MNGEAITGSNDQVLSALEGYAGRNETFDEGLDQLTQERLKDLIDQAVSRGKDPRFLADSVEKLRRMDEVNRKVLVEYVSNGKTTQPCPHPSNCAP